VYRFTPDVSWPLVFAQSDELGVAEETVLRPLDKRHFDDDLLAPHTRAEIFRRIASETTPSCPFVNLPSSRTGHWGEGITAADMKTLRWVKPICVGGVADGASAAVP